MSQEPTGAYSALQLTEDKTGVYISSVTFYGAVNPSQGGTEEHENAVAGVCVNLNDS